MKKIISLLTVFLIMLTGVTPVFSVSAKSPERKTVRVGWYESTYCYTDKFGRKSGMVYEYQQKVAVHTGWNYEYVKDSWPNLMQMLKNGEIDLMSDVSYTEERANSMLFSSLEMGTESYYIYTDVNNKTINSENLSSFNGTKIGVNKDSIQLGLLKDWMKKNNITAEIVELTDNQFDTLAMVSKGEIDAIVTLDTLNSIEKMIPVCKIGSSDFYFAVNKNRPDLLKELDMAMNRIIDEDPYFNEKLMDEWIHFTRTNAFLSPDIEKWLSEHGKIRVGYMDNYLPFCSYDKSSGMVTGALADYLAGASSCLKNADISFETFPYPTTRDALEAMDKREVDCVFPISLSSYDGEINGILTTAPVMQTEMSVMVRNNDRSEINSGSKLTVAVNKENENLNTFVKDCVPDWEVMLFPDTEGCYKAVSDHIADAVLISNYRTDLLEDLAKKYRLRSVPLGEIMRFSFATKRDNSELYSIMEKISNLNSDNSMEFVIASYMKPEQNISLLQILGDNWIIVVVVISSVFVIFLILFSKKLKAEKKIIEQQKQIEESLRRELQNQKELQSVTKKAYTDPLTGVKSKHSFNEAEEKMDQRIKERSVSEFAIVIFDLNNLKTINDTKGHQAGDRYIKDACKIICTCFKHSPVYRIGGDEFVAVLQGEDYARREDLISSFENDMNTNSAAGNVSIASGISCYDPENDLNTRMVFERADEKMYQRKKQMKDSKTV